MSAENVSILFTHEVIQLLNENQIDEATRLCEQGIIAFPFSADGHYLMGRCYHNQRKLQEARTEYERALSFAPGHLQALKHLSNLHYEQGEEQSGDDLLLQAAVYNPLDSQVMNVIREKDLYSRIFPAEKLQEQPEVSHQPEETIQLDDQLSAEESPSPEAEAEVSRLELDFEADISELQSDKKAEALLDAFESGVNIPDTAESQDAYEVNNIVENITEDDQPLDLSQYKNVDDDFATLMEGIFKDSMDEEGEDDLLDSLESEKTETEKEQEEIAQEPSDLDTSIIFLEKKHSDGEPEAVEEDELDESGQDTSQTPIPEGFSQLESDLERLPADETSQSADAFSGVLDQIEASHVGGLEESVPAADDQEEASSIEAIMGNPSLLTPTFGEILIAQKKFDDAHRVFSELIKNQPDNPRLQRKLEFLNKVRQVAGK